MKRQRNIRKIIISMMTCTGILFSLNGMALPAPAEEPAGQEQPGEAIQETAEPQAESAQAGVKHYKYEEINLEDAISISISGGTDKEQQSIIAIRNGQELSGEEMEDSDISFDGQQLELGEGTYLLSGSLEGQVRVKAGKSSEAVLVLDNFTVANPDDAAILCTKTESLVVMLADGSENVIASGEEVEINEESCTLAEDASGGALHSKAETIITGPGSLTVCGFINNGIHVTKSLTIDSGKIQVTAVNNGIKVKNTFYGNGGNLAVLAGNDGIKAETEAQEAQEAQYDEETGELLVEAQDQEEAAGWIEINDGIISVESYNDGIEALLDLTINGAFINIVANGTYISKGAYRSTFDKTFSAKGLKSGGTLQINNGTIIVKSYNDGVHAAGIITVNGGVLSVYCGDDGIHSDVQIDINDGTINISNSYEGIEANQININNGTITLFAWDDGMNANGGRGFGSRGGRSDTPTETPNLNVNGGDIYVNARGDGMDSNGNITVTGGRLVVDGPTDSWNGPLDGGTESGGVISISGGVVFAGGASSMAESFSNKSEQNSFLALLNSGYQGGAQIRILTPEGEELFSHEPVTGGTSIVFSCPELQKDETYILWIDEDSYEVALTGVSARVQLRKTNAE